MVPRQEPCERFRRAPRPRVASDGDQRRPRGGAAPPPAPRRAGRLRRDAWVVAAIGRAALRAAKLWRARESQTGMGCQRGQVPNASRESIGLCAGSGVSQGVGSLTARIRCGVARHSLCNVGAGKCSNAYSVHATSHSSVSISNLRWRCTGTVEPGAKGYEVRWGEGRRSGVRDDEVIGGRANEVSGEAPSPITRVAPVLANRRVAERLVC